MESMFSAYSESLGFDKCFTDPSWWVLVFICAVPHILYAYIWLFTDSYVALCKQWRQIPCDFVAKVGVWIKVAQYFCFSMWYIQHGPMFSLWNMSLIRLAIGFLLVGIGQTFNYAVYKALGKDGVYYGSKLGRPGRWVEGFPFVVRDPQYFGCVLTIWGGTVLLYTPSHIAAGAIPLACAWTLCYAASSIIEGNF